jgi:GGDEF domain-containing protein
MAQRVCDAVVALPLLITASVGTASFPLGDLRATTPQVVIDELIAAADAAMYRAKCLGGNRIAHHSHEAADQYLSETG